MHQLARKKAKEEEVTHRQSEIVNARVWRVGDQMNLPSLEGSGRLLCMVSYIPIYSAYTHTGDGSLLRRAAATTPQCLPRVTDTLLGAAIAKFAKQRCIKPNQATGRDRHPHLYPRQCWC